MFFVFLFIPKTIMQNLFDFQEILLANTSSYKRYLWDKINWSNRLIAIKDPRASGKTPILLQQIKYNLTSKNIAL
mgnify:CR=1 FL=1